MMGLRTRDGIKIGRHRAASGSDLDAGALAELVGLGLIETHDDTLCTTPDGRLVLNGVLRRLMRAN